jgi:hypothetical protein
LVYPSQYVVDHGSWVRELPQALQALLQQISLEHPPVHLEQLVEFPAVQLREVFPTAQQQPFLPLDEFALLRPLAEELGLAHFVDGRVGMLHDVEFVVDDLTLRRPVLDAQAEGLPHVNAGRLNAFPLPVAQLAAKEHSDPPRAIDEPKHAL